MAHKPTKVTAVGEDGTLVDDFVIQEAGRVINVLNAPSPAATASLNIGRLIVDRLTSRMQSPDGLTAER